MFLQSLNELKEKGSLLRSYIAIQPIFWRKPHTIKDSSKFFDRRDLARLKGHIQRIMSADKYLFRRLSEKRIEGIRSWEYGLLLSLLQNEVASKDWRVLDVGPGNSTFPAFLSSYVKDVTTIDYANPLEPLSLEHRRLMRRSGVELTHGTMLQLPFQSEAFDLVTCISTIEHLDDPGTGEQRPYEEFLEMTQAGLREMSRVIRPGGYFYLTTDAYVPGLQTIDNWSKKRPGCTIWSAYHIQDIKPIFIDTIVDQGFEIVGDHNYDPELLMHDPSRCTFRGRYFTTFSIYARRIK